MSENLHSIPFEAYQGGDPYIFVCYSHLDIGVVFNDIKRLHQRGYRIWYDEGISPGEDWSEEIAKAIRKSTIFVFFVSDHSILSKNCRNEARFALKHERFFIPIYLQDTKLPDGLILHLESPQALMRYRLPKATYYERLERKLEALGVRNSTAELLHEPSPNDIAAGPKDTLAPVGPLLTKTERSKLSYLKKPWFLILGGSLVVLLILLAGLQSLSSRFSPSNTSSPTPTENNSASVNPSPKVQPSALPSGSLPPVNLEATGLRGNRDSKSKMAYPLGELDRPSRSGATVDAKAKSLTGIIEWLNVEQSQRYVPAPGKTYANVYSSDYCYLAGVYLPRVWWSPNAVEKLKQGQSVPPVYDQTATEQSTNRVFDWLEDYGSAVGWTRAADLTELQLAANSGKIALICAKRRDTSSGSGHISIVVPETGDHSAIRNKDGIVVQPLQSWAGVNNFKYVTRTWWEDTRFTEPTFWLHD